MSAVTVRKTGAAIWPWEARCREHSEQETFLFAGVGAVAFNTRGVGNRLWGLALLAANEHIRRRHAKAPTGPKSGPGAIQFGRPHR